MVLFCLIPAVLAFLALAAHFFRSGNLPLLLVSVAFAALLFFPRPWAPRLVQAGLALAAIEWLRTLAELVTARMSAGEPYVRLAIILGVVAAATGLCALIFRLRPVRCYYHLPPKDRIRH